jgi:V/A-type H+-transporting ATPase subunit K
MMELGPELADAALQAQGAGGPTLNDAGAAAIAVGLAALAAGYAERGIGAAAVGAIAEDDDMFVPGLIMTVLPETLVILALVVVFIVG